MITKHVDGTNGALRPAALAVRLISGCQGGGPFWNFFKFVGDGVGDLGFHIADAGVGVGCQAFNP